MINGLAEMITMIKVNELRVGNIIQFADKSQTIMVEEIFKTHPYPAYFIEWVSVKENGNSLLSNFTAVGLSTELLEQNGFKVINELEHYIVYSLPKGDMAKAMFSKEKKSLILNNIEREIYFLHQLQNVYFALTDEELEIQLPSN